MVTEDDLHRNLFITCGTAPASALAFIDDVDGPLHPEEEAAVACATPRRKRAFTAGRVLARRVLLKLGVEPPPLAVAPAGYPLWPPGIVGSISHTHEVAIAVAAPIGRLLAIGIDVEDPGPMPLGMDELIAPGQRIHAPPSLPLDPLKLLFSAKEAVGKALSPLYGARLNFADISVAIGVDPCGTRGQLVCTTLAPAMRRDPRLAELRARWWLSKAGLLCAAWCPA